MLILPQNTFMDTFSNDVYLYSLAPHGSDKLIHNLGIILSVLHLQISSQKNRKSGITTSGIGFQIQEKKVE